jgi:hypothetical protein
VPPSTCSDREPVAEIGPAIEAAENAGAKALNVLASPVLYDNREAIFGAVARARIPAMYHWPGMVAEGAHRRWAAPASDLSNPRAAAYQSSQWIEAGRQSGGAADDRCVKCQLEHGQGARTYSATLASRPRRRGDRMRGDCCNAAMSPLCHYAEIYIMAPGLSRFAAVACCRVLCCDT